MHRQETKSKKGLIWGIAILAVVLLDGGIWFGVHQQAQAKAAAASASSSKAAVRSRASAKKMREATQASEKAKDPVYKDFAADGLSFNQVQAAKQLDVTAVGDSVMLGSEYLYKELFPKIYFDAGVSRQIYEAPDLFKSLAASGKLADTVIIGLGSNGTFTDAEFASIMNTLGSKRQVYWINVHADTTWTDEVNRDLVSMSHRYRNLHIVDWHKASEGHDDWFVADKTHPTTEGQPHYVATVAKAVLAKVK